MITVGPGYKDHHRIEMESRKAGFTPTYLLSTEERPSIFPYVYENQGIVPALEYENLLLRPDLARAIPLQGFFDTFGISYLKDYVPTEAEKQFIRYLKAAARKYPV